MVLKKIDNRIRVLIENGVVNKHRSMFVIVGDHGRDQVVILHHMLSKATVVNARPSVLWCYKKELGFSSHRKKRMRQLQNKIKSGKLDVKGDDPFELFIAATNIRYCYYSETHKILGNTYGMCVLQDFEAFTPNVLARAIETVDGGGLVVILLTSVSSLKQLYTLTMDVHSRFRTEAHQDVVARFNERFLLSLASCPSCMVIDDQLNILPVSSHILNITPIPAKSMEDSLSPKEVELRELKSSLQDTQPLGRIVSCCYTLDQAKAVLKFMDAISEKSLRSTAVLTAARGRGKSAALGLAMASAVALGYSNIFVTAPSPENLKTVFELIFKGLDALEYQEHLDYEIIQSTNPDFNKAVVRVNIFREHRQTVQYIHPSDNQKLGQAELVCIDEAAAIPLPLVKALLGPYLVFMASTVSGYEGTGRSLSLKLVQQLRQQASTYGSGSNSPEMLKMVAGNKLGTGCSASGRILHEISLNEAIRYADADPVEAWLNNLLCLDAASMPRILSGCPVPNKCDLYYVNRDTLFSYHKASEVFLHRIMALCVASHYKNTPNDLQMLSDAPAFHIFVLLGPVTDTQSSLPEVLCVIQVCLEGEISKSTIMNSLSRGKRCAGDLIPWTVSQQFQDPDFPGLSGARIVRIATHPHYQGMGYGSRALSVLQKYYEGRILSLSEEGSGDMVQQLQSMEEKNVTLLEEQLSPRKHLPPLLLKLSERQAEHLDYLGVSYGLTAGLVRFWKRAGFTPVYLRQTPNDLTGEHSCIMLKVLGDEEQEGRWLPAFRKDFQRRFVSLLGYQFRSFHPSLALNILSEKRVNKHTGCLTQEELDLHMTQYDLKRLQLYAQNMVDYHLIMDLVPIITRLVFLGQANIRLSAIQSGLLLGLGLQYKTIEDLEKELDLSSSQLLALFNKVIRKISKFLSGIVEADVEGRMVEEKDVTITPAKQTLEEDLQESSDVLKAKQKAERTMQTDHGLAQYVIKGSKDDWKSALTGTTKSHIISVKGKFDQKRRLLDSSAEDVLKKKTKQKKVKHEHIPSTVFSA